MRISCRCSPDNLSYVIQDPTNGTLTKDATYFTWDNASSLKRWGRLCNVGVLGNIKSSMSMWTTRRIGTVSPAPPHTTYIYCYSNDSIPRLIQINTDGAVLFRTLGKPVDTTEGKSFRGCNTIYVS